jgi:competence protein ComEC
MRILVLAAALAALAGCPSPARTTRVERPTPSTGTLPVPPGETAAPRVTWKRVSSPGDIPSTPPEAGTYRIHMIDVGTGLAILVQGHDWAMLYDGGTNDPQEKPLRVVSYLAAVLGPSGDDLCVERGADAPGQRRPLQHVVLSHPHLDHGSALDLVVHCYDVANVWDSGRINEAVFYRDFLEAVGRSATASYHTAADVPSDHAIRIKGATVTIARWERFSEGDKIALGDGAAFTILHAEAKKLSDPNQNSIVLSVELGGSRILLVGDAESGDREDPSQPVGDVEQFLVEHHADQIRADILQVGHHGSKTSSRRGFLEAVKPRLALVSAGPKKYRTVTLPDAEVLAELRRLGAAVLRTDENDGDCSLPQRVGGESGPGGCDSYIISIESPGSAGARSTPEGSAK